MLHPKHSDLIVLGLGSGFGISENSLSKVHVQQRIKSTGRGRLQALELDTPG